MQKASKENSLMNISFTVGPIVAVRAYSLNKYIDNEGKCPARP